VSDLAPTPRASLRALLARACAIRETGMRPSIVLMAKLLTLDFIISGQIGMLSRHFVPFIGSFRHVGSPSAFRVALILIFSAAAVSLFLNRWARWACVVLGAVIAVSIVSSMKYYENNREYTALLLVLAGLDDPDGDSWVLRLQVVLLYFAAALNKVLLADWRDGHFFQAWMSYLHHGVWTRLANVLPTRVLAGLVSWTAIITEFLLAIGFALRRHIPVLIWVGVAYHTSLVLVMNRSFGMFWVAAPSAYLAFVTWPAAPLAVRCGQGLGRLGRWADVARRIDLEGAFRWQQLAGPELEFSLHGRTHRGWNALIWILLCNPVSYLVVVFFAALPQPEPRVMAAVVLALLAVIALGAWAERRESPRGAPVPATGVAGA
jgi:hypothetical protein